MLTFAAFVAAGMPARAQTAATPGVAESAATPRAIRHEIEQSV